MLIATAAQLASDAYLDRGEIIARTRNQVALAKRLDSGNLMIAFRGTDQPSDWLKYNLRRGRYSWIVQDSWIFKGFFDAWRELRTDVRQFVERYRAAAPVPPQVYLTGHSLGGAVALAAIADLKPDAVYTFGAPRTGNRQFCVRLDELALIVRVVNAADGVPVPGWLRGGRHPGTTVFFDRNGDVRINPAKVCMWFDRLLRIARDKRAPISDHSHEDYAVLCRDVTLKDLYGSGK